MKILIVEDSKIAAMVLLKHLEEGQMQGQIMVASSISETRELISNRRYDLIFLDVHLGDGKGIDIINELPPNQKLIFVTSDPEYAITAFDHNALDYLVKPVTKERFDKSMDRLRIKDESEGYIIIRADFNFHRINTSEILYAKSDADYLTLYTEDEKYTFHSTLKKFIQRLPDDKFKRCHRSYIVNTTKIDRMDKTSLELAGVEIPVNSSFKKEMNKQFTKD